MKFNTIIDTKNVEIEIQSYLSSSLIKINNQYNEIDCLQLSENSYSLIINNKVYYIACNREIDQYEVTVNNHTQIIQVKNELEFLLDKMGMKKEVVIDNRQINAQIPGLISKIFVNEGDYVKKGEKLFVLEAMKMENEITSVSKGVIKKIFVNSGISVEKGDLIIEMKK